MSNNVLLKKSSVAAKVPQADDLAYGELALNYADGKLYFKNSFNLIQSFTNDSTTVTLTGTQTLANKTLNSAVLTGTLNVNGTTGTSGQVLSSTGSGGLQWITLSASSLNNNGYSLSLDSSGNISIPGNITLTSTTLISINGSTGSSGNYLACGPSGLTWTNPPAGSLATLTDVNISSPQVQQVLTYTGSNWVNAASNAVVASAVFASSQYDMGYVYDSNITVHEDEGQITSIASTIYDLGVLSFTGIISLNNIDQSVKSDYLGYSIIFGF
jgi:hypothetical protein